MRLQFKSGTDMSQESAQARLNRSIVHIDFMIGNEHMDIDGIKADGTRVLSSARADGPTKLEDVEDADTRCKPRP